MPLEDLLLGKHLDPDFFFADAEAKKIGVRFPAPPKQVIESWVWIQPLTESAPRRAIRVSMYRDGLLQSETYRDPADPTRTWNIATPLVDPPITFQGTVNR